MSGNSGEYIDQTQGTPPAATAPQAPSAPIPGIHDFGHFLLWEQASRDAIMVKRIYIDMSGDIIAGLMLSQIIYWHLPTDQGHTRLRIVKDGIFWLAKSHSEWWDECRLTADQSRRAIKILKDRGLIVTQVMKFGGSPTVHLRLDQQRFLTELNRYGLKPISIRDRTQNQMGGNPNPFGIEPTSYKQTLPTDTTADITTAAAKGTPPADRPTRRGKTPAAAANSDSSNPDAETPVPVDLVGLVGKLIAAGLNRADANRLAASDPDECRRQLLYLPFVEAFKTSPGAYLRSGIEQGFSAPKGYAEALAAQAAATKRAEAAERRRREAMESQEGTLPPAGDQRRDRAQAERARIEAEEPERFAKLLAAAEAKVPGGLQRKKGESYRRTLEQILRSLIAEEQGI